MASLSLVLEKSEESHVKIIPAEVNLPTIVGNFNFGHYDSIAIILLGVDKIQKVKEERGAAIWFRSFVIVEEEVAAIKFWKFDIGEGSLDMVILGVNTLLVWEKQKQQNGREDRTQLRRRRRARKKRRRINQIVNAGIG